MEQEKKFQDQKNLERKFEIYNKFVQIPLKVKGIYYSKEDEQKLYQDEQENLALQQELIAQDPLMYTINKVLQENLYGNISNNSEFMKYLKTKEGQKFSSQEIELHCQYYSETSKYENFKNGSVKPVQPEDFNDYLYQLMKKQNNY